MTDYQGLIRTLTDGQVEFIIVGGLAATAHGSARLTQDVKDLEAVAELEALLKESR
jgi:hypothetical protein